MSISFERLSRLKRPALLAPLLLLGDGRPLAVKDGGCLHSADEVILTSAGGWVGCESFGLRRYEIWCMRLQAASLNAGPEWVEQAHALL